MTFQLLQQANSLYQSTGVADLSLPELEGNNIFTLNLFVPFHLA